MGTALPTGPGQITLRDDAMSGDTIIQLNAGGDLNPESEIAIRDGYSVLASSYTASDFIVEATNILQNGSFELGTGPGDFLPLSPGSKDITGRQAPSSIPPRTSGSTCARPGLSNRVFESYEAICEACCQVWRKLTAEAGRIQTIATRSWATIGQNP